MTTSGDRSPENVRQVLQTAATVFGVGAVAELLRRWSTGPQHAPGPSGGAELGVERGRAAGLTGAVSGDEAVAVAVGMVEEARTGADAAGGRPVTDEQAALMAEWIALALFAGASQERVSEILEDVCGDWG